MKIRRIVIETSEPSTTADAWSRTIPEGVHITVTEECSRADLLAGIDRALDTFETEGYRILMTQVP